ncbi:MAG TPA: GxxExxY protein, partial [Phycisphaerales bacterium]|nr:GxxExxY protein [Phycisphaerales bacterium]
AYGGGGHGGGGYGGGGGGYGGGGYGGGGARRGRGRNDRDQRGDRGGERGDPDGRGLPLSELDPALTEVSRRVIGAAIEVHKALGPGFTRDVYMAALKAELAQHGVRFAAEHRVPVLYKGARVGERIADLLVDDRFVVELVAQRGEIGGTERAALRALLRAADLELGLIINFAERRLKDGLVRVLNPEKLGAMRQGAAGAPPGGPGTEHDDVYDAGGGDAPTAGG